MCSVFSRGAREGSIISDATHGRVVMAVSFKTSQRSKYLKQVVSVMVEDGDMGSCFNSELTFV